MGRSLTQSEKIALAMQRSAARFTAMGGVSSVSPPSRPLTLACIHGGTDADIIDAERCRSCGGGSRHVRKCSVHREPPLRDGVCTLVESDPAIMSCEECREDGLGYSPVPPTVREKKEPHPLIAESHDFAVSIPSYPHGRYSGRGIVICGGGKYWPSVYVTVRMIRHVGCTLPIQVWYLGDAERDERYTALLSPHGVEVVDALAHPAAAETRGLMGFQGQPPFEVKSFAVLHSPFEEVLYLDADCYPCADPTEIFSESRYRYTGGVFWPDLTGTVKWTRWEQWGVPSFGQQIGWEVGQYVINKRKAWRQLQMARWYDDHGDWCYGGSNHHDHGDKGSWRVAWAIFRTAPTFYATAATWKSFAFLQMGPNGVEPTFIHRCRSKLVLSPTHFPSTPQNGVNQRAGLPMEESAFEFLDELSRILNQPTLTKFTVRVGNEYDASIFNSVITRDEYGVARRDLTGKSVLDLGAHIGCFSYLAESRGAGPLHAYEPNIGNYVILRRNLKSGKAFCEGVGYSKGWGQFQSDVPAPEGLAGTFLESPEGKTPIIRLDDVLLRLTAETRDGRVNLLKIDAEGAEWGILSGSLRLDLVDEIVGEWHEYTWSECDWKPNDLHELLPGFTVEIQPPNPGTTWGLFRAVRRM